MLSLTAVHDNQVGKERERFVDPPAGPVILFLSRLPAFQPPRQHLCHRFEVIRSFDRFDIKTPVMGLARNTLLKNDHRSDRERPLRIRNIVAFDPIRGPRKLQRGFQLRKRLTLLMGIVGPLRLQRAQRLGLHPGPR